QGVAFLLQSPQSVLGLLELILERLGGLPISILPEALLPGPHLLDRHLEAPHLSVRLDQSFDVYIRAFSTNSLAYNVRISAYERDIDHGWPSNEPLGAPIIRAIFGRNG